MNPVYLTTEALVAVLGSIPNRLGPDPLKNVSIDSRTLRSGELFIALKGPHYNGHQFLVEAYKKGARAAIVEAPEPLAAFPQLQVADTQKALYDLARYIQKQAHYKTIAITGSAGKTSLREMVVRILSNHHAVLSPEKNFNNLIGVPITLLNAQTSCSYAVLELGTSAPGEIKALGNLVHANIGIISNIGMAHVAGLGSLEGIHREKYSLWETLQFGSTAIYHANSGSPSDWKWPSHITQRWSFSEDDPKADYFIQSRRTSLPCNQHIHLRTPQGYIELTLSALGAHQALNAAAAAAAGMAAGCSPDDIIQQLATFNPLTGRGHRKILKENHTWIDDSYNANELSVRAAIELLDEIPGYSILVLGTLSELGHFEEEILHRLGHYARTKSIDLILGVGPRLQPFTRSAQAIALHSLEETAAFLVDVLRRQRNTTTLVKGSRIATLEHLFPLVEAAL